MARTIFDKAIKDFLDVERGRKKSKGIFAYSESWELYFLNIRMFDPSLVSLPATL